MFMLKAVIKARLLSRYFYGTNVKARPYVPLGRKRKGKCQSEQA